MPTLKPFLRLALLAAFFILHSCVKDVDLHQIDEVVIPPKAALNLVYFTLSSDDFIRNQDQNSRGTVSDLVRLEFLDDDYIRDGLVQAEFQFKYTNGFSFPLVSTVTFLSENNVVQYQFSFPIAAGSPGNPKITNHFETIDRKNIEVIKKSIKMRIELESQSRANPFSGELQLKSKAFYNFEF
ncbi:MAG TPA: hypothetical protein VFI78_07150 [Salinimicrobium sp.]|nr:hypothetical protein [Salinimicrobium sp.]